MGKPTRLVMFSGRGASVARRAFLTAALTLPAAVTHPARADTSYDPTTDRMAVTDRSADPDIQPRIWLLTNGGSPPGKYLMTRGADVAINGWFGPIKTGLDSGLDAVDWNDGTQHQRVFYVRSGNIYMLNYDTNLPGAETCISCSIYPTLIQGTDIAAITFLDGGVRRIAVAAGCNLSGLQGYLCICESDLTNPATCMVSTDRPLPSGSPLNHDIVGVVAGSPTLSQEFYFRNGYATLSRSRRTGVATWIAHEDLNTPNAPIYPSIVAMPSQLSIPGKITLGVIGSDGLIHTIRITPTENPPEGNWYPQAALPGGVTPITTPTAFGAVRYRYTTGGTNYDREMLSVISTPNYGLYHIATFNPSGTWYTAWNAGPLYSPSGYMASIGVMTTTSDPATRRPRTFGSVGYPTATLQEYSYGTAKWNDHVKYQNDPVGVGDSTLSVAETSSAADLYLGLMTGIDRNYPNQWLVRLRSSTDGANTYGASDVILTTTNGQALAYSSDPTVDVAGGLLHFTSMEVDFNNGGCFYNHGGSNTTRTDINYRRGTSAAAISSALNTPNAFTVDQDFTVSPGGGLDHPWTVMTTDAFGSAVAHVVYWSIEPTTMCGVDDGICYWKLPAGSSTPQRTGNCTGCFPPISQLTGGPARAVRGADNEVYAFTDLIDAWGKICTLKNALTTNGVQAADCDTLGGNQGPIPTGEDFLVSVGPALSSWPDPHIRCDTIPPGGNGTKYKCFDTGPERAVAADPTTPLKVYVAYVLITATGSDIFFTKSTGGTQWGPWGLSGVTNPYCTTPPCPKQLTSGGGYWYDPQITVDSDGTIIVTYSRIYTSQEAPSGAANLYTVYSTDGGSSWATGVPAKAWNTSSIQYHCHRGNYFMGDYRQSKAFGNRAYTSYQLGGTVTTPYTYRGHWMSKWAL